MTTDAHPAEPHALPTAGSDIPQLTLRAISTGMILGAILSLCNIYAGLKIGWGFNMSVTAALLSYGFWMASQALFRTRHWNILENNVNQTSASAAASISSAGLVAPIPALTMLTGETLSWPVLVLWTFAVSVLGIVVALGLRKQMILVDKLPFPGGIATGETLKEMYARGREAVAKVLMLLGGAVAASTLKIVSTVAAIGATAIPGAIGVVPGGALAVKGYTAVSLKNLGFAFDPSLLFIGVGALIGIRAGLSMLIGAIIAWLVIGPAVLEAGWANPGRNDPDAMWYGAMVNWMLWPGVAMMVAASLTSFAFSWRSVLAAMRGSRGPDSAPDPHDLTRSTFLRLAIAAAIFAVVLQMAFFDIGVAIATLGVLLTFVLAIVAARVSGETGITPVGPMGKVTQLTFGAIEPGNVAANLMTANVTAGAASQGADLLHDMKTGHMIGASPRFLAIAQFFGVLAGALAGSAAYLLLVPDPLGMLMTEEWAAPAVAQWKAVAELFKDGVDTMPSGAVTAMLWGAILGVVFAIAEKALPKRVARWIPSPTAVGLAFVIPAYYSVSMFLGAFLGVLVARFAKTWSARFTIVLASGLVAGDSLTGAIMAIVKFVTGG